MSSFAWRVLFMCGLRGDCSLYCAKPPKWGMRLNRCNRLARETKNGRENPMPVVPTPSTFEIDVSCPNCGTKTKKPLVWLRDNDEFVCNQCGTTVDQCGQLVAEVEKTTGAR